MLSLINRFRTDERGASAVEYAMLVVFIGLAIAVGAQTVGADINGLFDKIGTSLVAINPPAPPATP